MVGARRRGARHGLRARARRSTRPWTRRSTSQRATRAPAARLEHADCRSRARASCSARRCTWRPSSSRGERTDARTDQFSFCVALYEALYGAHPFAGRAAGRADGGGHRRARPAGAARSTVPPWLRRILLRGLSVDPALRWESMEALATALSRDPARQRRRWLAGVAIGAAVRGGVRGRALARTAESRLRRRPGPPRRRVGARRGRGSVRPARRHAGRLLADRRRRRGRRLGARRRVLDATRPTGCACTRTPAAPPGPRRAVVGGLSTCAWPAFTSASARQGAHRRVRRRQPRRHRERGQRGERALPLEGCADVKLLRAVIPPPDSPAIRARVEELRKDLARTKALHDSGQCGACRSRDAA